MNPRLSSLTLSILAIGLSQISISIAHAKPLTNQNFNQMVFFGDSLSDSGYYTNFNPILGKFTTNPDQVWTQTLAQSYGLDAIANSNGIKGNNYAAGGAISKGYKDSDEIRDLSGNGTIIVPMPSATTQVKTYLSSNNGKADTNTLYSVWIGANNMLNITDPNNAVSTMTLAASDTSKTVQTLADAGAKYIVVPNLPDVGKSPMALSSGTSATSTQLTAYYNNSLYAALNKSTANVIPIDTFSMLQEVVANPSLYGLTNVTQPACAFTKDGSKLPSSLVCNKSNLTVDSSKYLFADGVHPTGAVHDIIANYTKSVLETPSQYAKIANISTQSGWMQDLQLSQRMATLDKGSHGVWAEGVFLNSQGGVGEQEASYESDSVDSSGMIGAGLALGEHSQTGMYLQRKQADYQIDKDVKADIEQTGFGVYHTHELDIKGNDYLLDVRAGIDSLNIDWERNFQFKGQGTRTHTAETGGRRKHLSLQVGRAFQPNITGKFSGKLSQNNKLNVTPYVGALLQNVRINSLMEDNPTLSTSMKFDTYDQDSLLGSIGVKLDYPINDTYNLLGDFRYSHDFKDDGADKMVKANLQSVTAYERGFFLPVQGGTEPNNFGVSLAVNGRLTKAVDFQVGATAQGADADDYQAGAFVGLNASF